MNVLSNGIESEIIENIDHVCKSSVTGTNTIEILRHELISRKNLDNTGKGVFINLINISEANIGKAVFQAIFYDDKGMIIDTINSNMYDICKGQTRVLRIELPKENCSDVKSYHVQIIKTISTPIPEVTGNNQVTILNHSLRDSNNDDPSIIKNSYIDISIRNISNETIAVATFEAIFYGSEGNILDKVNHKEYDLKPNHSRLIVIMTDKVSSNISKSYCVSLLKVITSAVQKIIVCGEKIKTIEGGEEVNGYLKNISNVIVDATIVAIFKDWRGEVIGTKVLFVRNIEPETVKKFQMHFNTQNGEIVRSFTIHVAEMADVID
jgi:hypothetical protein